MADLIIKQGADFFHRFIIKSSLGDTVDLTGYTGAAQFRDAPGGTLYGAFTVATGGANGFLDLSMDDAVTDTLTPGSYVYDVFITNAATDDVQNVTSGAVRVLQRITV